MSMDNGMDVSPSWQELKDERDTLASEARGLRQVVNRLGAENREIRAERDALAAHVERLRVALEYSHDYLNAGQLNSIGHGSKAHWEMQNALGSSPATSLTRLKAQWQAEALEVFASGIRAENDEGATADLYGMASLMEASAKQFRRQAEEATHAQ